MIRTKTVFILGAGASNPYGYPLGRGLYELIRDERDLELIINALRLYYYEKAQENGQILTYPFRDREIKEHMESKIEEFKLKMKMASLPSIDYFLEQRYKDSIDLARREESLILGKIMIAKILINNEIQENIYSSVNKDDWYNYIWQRYVFQREYEDFHNSINMSFITFNYDRSLEFFLFNVIKTTYNKSNAETKEILNKFNIIHLYGSLGDLPWQGSGGWEYSDKVDVKRYVSCVKKIHILTEERKKSFDDARNLISDANNIIFLGFGYDSENLDNLQISNMKNKNIFGSTFGFTVEEDAEIRLNFEKQSSEKIATGNLKNLDFLRSILPKLSVYPKIIKKQNKNRVYFLK